MAESISLKDTLYWNRVAEAAVTQEAAFAQLYDAFFPVIYRRLLAKSCNIELTEEAVSRAFVKMYEHLGTFDAGKASFATWLVCIADNEMKMLYRGKSYARVEDWPEDFQPPAPAEEEPEARALRQEQQDELKAALAQLPPKERQILQMTYWLDMSAAQIGEALSMTPEAVWKNLSRARKTLLKILQ